MKQTELSGERSHKEEQTHRQSELSLIHTVPVRTQRTRVTKIPQNIYAHNFGSLNTHRLNHDLDKNCLLVYFTQQ